MQVSKLLCTLQAVTKWLYVTGRMEVAKTSLPSLASLPALQLLAEDAPHGLPVLPTHPASMLHDTGNTQSCLLHFSCFLLHMD